MPHIGTSPGDSNRLFHAAEQLTHRVLSEEADAIAAGETHPCPTSGLLHPDVARGWKAIPGPTQEAAPRVLFKLEAFTHPTMGPWVGAIVSQRTTMGRGLGKFELLLAIHGDPLRVQGLWSVCTACVALGVDGHGARCLECSGMGWDPWHGAPSDQLGTMTAVRQIRRPGSSHYKPAFRRDPS